MREGETGAMNSADDGVWSIISRDSVALSGCCLVMLVND